MYLTVDDPLTADLTVDDWAGKGGCRGHPTREAESSGPGHSDSEERHPRQPCLRASARGTAVAVVVVSV